MFTRVLTERDAAAFHPIRRRALDEDAEVRGMEPEWMQSAPALAERFKSEWDGQGGFFMGAFDSALVGIIFCGRDGRTSAKLSALYVIPERRRHGVGWRLLLDAVDRARQWPDLERLWLDVAITNEPARALYVSCGFRIIGPGELLDEERMALDLR
jgi:ribosomal protein S18 acetylase RimI-like enzyme